MKINMVNSSGTVANSENKTSNAEINKIETDKAENAEAVDRFQLKKAVDTLNQKAKETDYNVRFAIYKDTNRIIVEVVDNTTKQVVSTYPPKQILEMARMVDQEFKVLDKKI